MLAGAILVVGQHSRETHWTRKDSWGGTSEPGMLGGKPIACLDLLGQSVLDRTIQRLHHDGVKLVTVVIGEEFSHLVRTSAAVIHSVPAPANLWSAAECVLREYVQHGVELVLLTRLGAYAELDLGHLIRFHRDAKQGVTILTKDCEPLDTWVIDAHEVRKTRRMGLPVLLDREDLLGVAPYVLEGYVCRMEDAADLRRLAVDAFLSQCPIRPKGRERMPGVWFGEGAEAHRRARIVAPAYLGSGARLCADALLTRFAAVERGCCIREGSIIEDASILANTYVGKGLLVAHAVVDGNQLLPLRHNVMVEIQDRKLLGHTVAAEASRSAAASGSVSLAERLLTTAWN